ncbi:MAG: hypothetical protein ACR2H2_01895, partial [Solirubrobacteraceae bacterium]
MSKHTLVAVLAGCAVAAGSVAATSGAAPDGNGDLPQGSEPVTLDPADFTTEIDNPYWPMRPGSEWVYRATDTTGTRQDVVITVTGETKLIANGITARVVRDVVTEKGAKVEVSRVDGEAPCQPCGCRSPRRRPPNRTCPFPSIRLSTGRALFA